MRLMPLFVFPLTLLAAASAERGHAQNDVPVHGKSGIALAAAPATKSAPVTDEYKSDGSSDGSGEPVKVTDGYRWLEDAQSPETRAFITAQNAYTQKYLDQVKILPQVREQMTSLLRVDVVGVPMERKGKYFFSKRLASENQGSIYVRQGLRGTDERLIDANTLSAD
jgi:prolyl oligopeptidase